MKGNNGKFGSRSRLTILTPRDVIPKAKKRVEVEMLAEQGGLKTRFDNFNRSLNKYARPANNILIGGGSGMGKSFFKRMIIYDFLNTYDYIIQSKAGFDYFNWGRPEIAPKKVKLQIEDRTISKCFAQVGNDYVDVSDLSVKFDGDKSSLISAEYHTDSGFFKIGDTYRRKGINSKYKKKVIIIEFSYEMTPEDEMLMAAGNYMGYNYTKLTSANWDAKRNLYTKLSAEEKVCVDEMMDNFSNLYHYIISIANTIDEERAVVDYIINDFFTKNSTTHIDDVTIVIVKDHTLLTRTCKLYKTRMDTQGGNATNAIEYKQAYNALGIWLNQYNGDIETTERITKPANHYPRKKDLYYGGELTWAMDDIYCLNRPEILNINSYGVRKLSTKGLLHLRKVKSRFGLLGDTFYQTDFLNGRVYPSHVSNFMIANERTNKSRQRN